MGNRVSGVLPIRVLRAPPRRPTAGLQAARRSLPAGVRWVWSRSERELDGHHAVEIVVSTADPHPVSTTTPPAPSRRIEHWTLLNVCVTLAEAMSTPCSVNRAESIGPRVRLRWHDGQLKLSVSTARPLVGGAGGLRSRWEELWRTWSGSGRPDTTCLCSMMHARQPRSARAPTTTSSSTTTPPSRVHARLGARRSGVVYHRPRLDQWHDCQRCAHLCPAHAVRPR